MLETTPVLIGGGQFTYRGEPAQAPTPLELITMVSLEAAGDARLSADSLRGLDGLAVVGFAIDAPGALAELPVPRLTNPPASLARTLGASPRWSPYTQMGGNSPQHLINTICERIAKGGKRVCAGRRRGVSGLADASSGAEPAPRPLWRPQRRARRGGASAHRRCATGRHAPRSDPRPGPAGERLSDVRKRLARPRPSLARRPSAALGAPVRAVHQGRRGQPLRLVSHRSPRRRSGRRRSPEPHDQLSLSQVSERHHAGGSIGRRFDRQRRKGAGPGCSGRPLGLSPWLRRRRRSVVSTRAPELLRQPGHAIDKRASA